MPNIFSLNIRNFFIQLSILVLVSLSFGSFAQTKKMTREEYIQKFKKLAIEEMKRSGVPASITLAQGCLESGNGNSTLAAKSNNHFGIKCKSSWRGKKVYHDDDEKGECFRKYDRVEHSYADHSDFLLNNPRYGSLFLLDITDYKGWARGLKKAGYATNPKYADHLIKIIEDNQLQVYDRVADLNMLAKIEEARHDSKDKPVTAIIPMSTRKITVINGLKTIVVQPGDTFESIAQEFGMKDWEIYNYNDYKKGYKPRVNEILYIEYKPKRADRNHLTHRVDSGDTMHFIAQRYGIKLKPLYSRNRMKKGEEPKEGDIIYLRHKKPKEK